MPDDVADHQQRGVLRPFGDQVEVAADLLGGGHERRGQLQAGALGQLGRGERVADRPQVVQLVLGRPETLAQGRELLVAQLRLSTEPRDQRVLAILVLAHVADVVLARVDLGVQPPKLRPLVHLFALHRSGAILPDRAPHVHPPDVGLAPT